MNCYNCSQPLSSADQPCPQCGAFPGEAPSGPPTWSPTRSAPPAWAPTAAGPPESSPAEWAQWAPPGSPAASDQSAPPGWPAAGPPPSDPTSGLPGGYFAETDGPPAAKRRGRSRLVGAMAIALIPLLVVAIVVQRANRGTSVGAATAQGAVSDLATAVDKQDVLGALASIAPEESAAATNIVKALIDKAQQTKLIASSSKPLAGLTARVDGLRLSTHQLHPLVSRVDVTAGTLSYSFDPSQLAGTLRSDLGNSLRPSSGAVTAAQGQIAVDNFNQTSKNKLSGVYIMTVKRNGRWFVSPFYTVAEYLREAGGLPAANYDSTTQGQLTGGATSPEGVVRNLFAGTLTDPTKSLTALPPDSLRVIYDYMGDISALVASLSKGAGLGTSNGPKTVLKVINLRTSSQPAGANGAQVNLDALTVVATISGTRLADNFNTGCAPSAVGGATPDLGSSSGSSASSSGSVVIPSSSFRFAACPPPSTPPAAVAYTETVTLTLTGTCYSIKAAGTSSAVMSGGNTSGCLAKVAPGLKLASFFVMTVKERGGWYVDPLGTVAAYLKVVVTQATPADVECLLRKSHDSGNQQPATQAACAKSTMFRRG